MLENATFAHFETLNTMEQLRLGHKTADARRRFRELDKDKNNCVAPDELRQALRDMNIQMSDKHVRRRLPRGFLVFDATRFHIMERAK